MYRNVILFLAANPSGTSHLELSEECAQIQRELKMCLYRDDFDFHSRWAVSIDELMRHLMELEPTVIHFSGHGEGSTNLVFQDEHGFPQPVPARALAMAVASAAQKLRIVVLNACYSSAQAEILRTNVDCTVGMSGKIGDYAARVFATRFYSALGNRRSVGNAVEQGIAALAAKQLPEELMPRCVTRGDLDARDIFLHRPASRRGSHCEGNSQEHRPLYTWLHISDIHLGNGDLLERAYRRVMLDEIRRDAREVCQSRDFELHAIFVAGDIAFTGGADSAIDDEYREAAAWLRSIARDLDVNVDSIHVVPGNHDIDRTTDNVADIHSLISELRNEPNRINELLIDNRKYDLISERFKGFQNFWHQIAEQNSNSNTLPLLYWQRRLAIAGGINLRIIGFNTAILCTGNNDHGNLTIGLTQIVRTLTELQDNEIVIVLSHHPLNDGWLSDEEIIVPLVFNRTHIQISGHRHCSSILHQQHLQPGRISSKEKPASCEGATRRTRSDYRYNLSSIMVAPSGQVFLRVWPRRWSPGSTAFEPDVDNSSSSKDGQIFADFPLSIGRNVIAPCDSARFKWLFSRSGDGRLLS